MEHTQQKAARVTLSITAAILGGLILLQTVGIPSASAHMVSKTGAYTGMTANGGSTGELLFVIDDRNEDLLVYSVQQARSVELRARESLPELFSIARNQALGVRP
ncbi:MAG: hypothetical protein KF757_06065 [Phycisphaeraceae bacterium]|nr:hypothetical protein [Phycisphaeraceae bacterium]MCW5763739.1 hypothetical protein [Phycisphaeraceae bacterium]